MKITIIETGENKELIITDPATGAQWTNDLLSDYFALPDYNDDTYHMLQDDYDWWYNLINDYQAADNRRYDILCFIDSEAMREEVRNINCDIEDFPGCLNQICDKYDK